jgi:hypothetical protein
MDIADEEMIHEQLSGKIIGAAMNVLNDLRAGDALAVQPAI